MTSLSETGSLSCGFLDLVVSARTQQAKDIISVELVDPGGHPLPSYEPGAHIDVHLGANFVRQYSLCGDPADRTRYVLGILRDPQSRGGSTAAHDQLVEGEAVRVSIPRNRFALDEKSQKTLLLAGGIGITPLLAMAYRLVALGKAFELHYCTRTMAQTAFLREIKTAGMLSSTHLHHDDGPPGQRLVLDELLARQDTATHLYVCGPPGFIEWVTGAASQAGWPGDAIHFEYFSADADKDGDAFSVEARRSGKIVTVAPDQTIADALQKAGVAVPLSCEEGVCGTCVTRVLDGIPDHRDVYLSANERAANQVMTVCCSRSRSPLLVLDI